ncbi:MAG TPA: T9SS type A sorting domain-containing protein, partial [Saprospiraceae bacterium]|nr:T9SS type A sorting domain-containing protein [Saprospiraceae bacterium]
GGQSYLWKGPGGFTSTQQNPVINVTSHVQGGTYWVTISNSNGCYVQLSVTLTVNYPPAVTATHDQSTACTGSTLKLFGTGIGTYLWTGPAGFTSSLQNPVIPNVTPANSGVYTLKVTNGSGCFAVASTTVSVVAPPNVTATVNDNTVCEGTNVYLYSGGASTYQWTGPWGWVSTFEDPIIYTIPAYMSGVYSVTGTGPTGCKSSASVTVNVYQLINGTVNAIPNPVLLGGTLQLNATGGTSYLWTGPGGFYSTQSNPVIHNFNYKNVGTYTVIITNEGGCEMTLFVTVDLVLPLQGDNVNNFTVSTTKLVEGHIYPNPSSNYITLQRHETASVVYSIIDMKGNVLIKNATTDSGQVNIESLTPGSYHVLWSQPGVARDAFKGSFIKVK